MEPVETAFVGPWGDIFRRARLEQSRRTGERWTRKRVAVAAGMTPNTYGRIEDGAHTSTTNLITICHVLDIPPSQIFTALDQIRRGELRTKYGGLDHQKVHASDTMNGGLQSNDDAVSGNPPLADHVANEYAPPFFRSTASSGEAVRHAREGPDGGGGGGGGYDSTGGGGAAETTFLGGGRGMARSPTAADVQGGDWSIKQEVLILRMQQHLLDELRREFDTLRREFDARFQRLEAVGASIDAKLSGVETAISALGLPRANLDDGEAPRSRDAGRDARRARSLSRPA